MDAEDRPSSRSIAICANTESRTASGIKSITLPLSGRNGTLLFRSSSRLSLADLIKIQEDECDRKLGNEYESCVLHHSKLPLLMSALGQTARSQAARRTALSRKAASE